MRKINSILFSLALLLFFITASVKAQTASWTAYKPALFPTNASGQIHGISRVSQMKFHPSNASKMYAVSARGGLFISTNGGTSWSVAPGCDNLPLGTRFASVCIDHTNDQVIYLGGGDHNYYSSGSGVFKSTDGGATFTATSLTGKIIVDMIMDPSNNNVIVAATNVGIYKTTDAGATWTLKGASTIAFDDLKKKENSSTRTLFASTCGAELYVSNDFGETWTQLTSGIFIPTGYTAGGGTRIGLTPADSNVVYFYMNAQGGTLFKSTNGGTSFTAVKNSLSPFLTGYTNNSADPGQGDYNTGLGIDRINSNIVYFVAHNVWKSTDGGATWAQLTNWYQKVHTDMHQVIVSPYNTSQVWDMNDGGVWLSTDGGNNWTPKSDGLYGYEIYHGGCSPTRRDMMSIGTQDNGELYATSTTWYTNRGGDWQSHCVFDYRANSSMVYYFLPDWGTVPVPKRRLVTGSDATYGLPASVSDFSDIAFFRGNPDLAFVGDTSVLRTTNLSVTTPTWTSILNTNVKIMAMHVNFADANKLYVITSDQKIYISTNALSVAPTFTSVTLPSASSTRASITSIKSSSNVVYITINNKVYRSADNGATWSAITYNLPSLNHVAIIADEYFSSNELVFLATGGTVYYKTATAVSWSQFSTGLPSRTSIVDMSIFNDGTSNTLLRVFTYGRGVWETPVNSLRSLNPNFTVDQQRPCLGQAVTFSDLSTGNVVTRSWSFPGGTPSSSTVANPVVTYSSSGSFNVTLTVSDGTTSSSTTQNNYINTTGTQLPVNQDFESGAFPPTGWNNIDAGNNAIAWQLKNGTGGFGASSNSMYFDNYASDAGGAYDEFRSLPADLVPYSTATLKFDVAYQPYSTTSYFDSLQVLISTDCGATFTSLYLKSGTALATATGTNTAAFVPTASQWRTETINLNTYVGRNVIVAFRNIGHYGNNIYIDNIQLNATLSANAGPDGSICSGSSTGIGSTPAQGITYSWSPSAGLSSSTVANPLASPSVTTSYVLTATYPLSGITSKDTVVVNVNNPPVLTTNSVAATGSNADGSATVNISGGASPFLINWNTTPTQSTATAVNLVAGTYQVTVTDANGCSSIATATVTQTGGCTITLSETHTNILCSGNSSGAVTAITSGANGAVLYSLQPTGATNSTGNFTGLSSGNYTLIATDANQCSASATFTITSPADLTATVSILSPVQCYNGTATISVTATGGTQPYTGAGNFSVTAGNYSYTVTDAVGCTAVTPIISVVQPSQLVASSSSTSILCNGGSSTITVTASGGVSPYTGTGTYQVTAGSYSYTVRDANNCVATTNITITQPNSLTATSTSTAILCNGGNSTVTVTANGGVIPYTGTGNFQVTAGSYSYTVRDANNCAATTNITVTQPNSLTASATSTAILCNGGNSTVTVAASGGVLPYTGTGNFQVTAGSYSYTVRDANNCVSTTSITITQPTILTATSSATVIACYGGTATVTVSANGGSPAYSGTGNFTVVAGSYNYTVTDSKGCTASTAVTVSQPAAFTMSITASGPLTFCQGGSVVLTASAASGYTWSNGATTASITVTSSGTYSVTGVNASGCSATASGVSITVNPSVTPTISISANPTGTIYSTTSVTFTATITSGGATPLYQWKKNGLNVGTSAATYTNNAWVNGDAVTCTLTSNASCLTSSSATSNQIVLAVVTVGAPKFVVTDITQNKAFYYDSAFAFVSANNLSTSVLNAVTNVADVAFAGNYAYILDQTNKKIYRSNAAGTAATASRVLVSTTGTAIGTPTGLAISGDTLWVLDKSGRAIFRYSLGSAFTGTTNLNAAAKISLNNKNTNGESLIASSGFFYVLDNGTSKTLYRYTKTGGSATTSRAMLSNTGTALSTVTGVTFINSDIRIVDSGLDRSLTYSLSALFTGTGGLNGTLNNTLEATNLNATGIAIVSTSSLLRNSDQPFISVESIAVKAFPNPAAENVKVLVEGDLDENATVVLYDINGKLIKQLGMNAENILSKEFIFDLSELPQGMYVVAVVNKEERKTILVVHE